MCRVVQDVRSIGCVPESSIADVARMRPFERFDAWQRAHSLVLACYKSSRGWPSDERFGLTHQLKKAVVSVEANIAEGSAKRGAAEFRRYLDISNGSLAEVNALLLVARDLGYLPHDNWNELDDLSSETGRLLFGLYRSLGR